MARQGILRPFGKWAYFRPICKPRAKKKKKKYFRFSHIFLCFFFNRFNIIRSSPQKYGQIGNFKVFQKMGLLLIDIQSQRQKKKNYFRFFNIFLYFFLPDFILLDWDDKNMNRQGILKPFRTCAYFRTIFKPRAKKIIFDFSIFFFIFFFTDSILSDRADKNADRWEFQGLSDNRPTSNRHLNTETKKIIFSFSIFFFMVFSRLKI